MTPDSQATTTDAVETAKCSKCWEPLDTEGSPLWCKKCRAQYQRDYKSLLGDKKFMQGVAAMRDTLADGFEAITGGGSFSTLEIAHIIRNSKGPV